MIKNNIILLLLALLFAVLGTKFAIAPRAEGAEIVRELSIQEKIELKAIEYGHDPKILLKIAECESHFRNVPNYLYDGEEGRYTAYGPFQILRSTARDYSDKDRREVDNNIEIAMKLYADRGISPWSESFNCLLTQSS